MKSHIYISPLKGNAMTTAAPDSAVLRTSKNEWAGIKVEHHLLPPGNMPEHAVQDHRLTINMGSSFNSEWKSGSKWNIRNTNTGDFTMLSHGDVNAPRWNKTFEFAAIALRPDFVDRLIEVDHFRFREQRSVSDPLVRHLSWMLVQELREENFTGKIYAESLAVALAIHLASNYPDQKKTIRIPKGKLSSAQLSAVLDFVHSNLHHNISLDEVAGLANISPFHFSRLFKNALGISPYQYVLRMKIERAQRLLRSSKRSLTHIALELGFADQAHFSNAFKKVTGLSPRHFR